MSRFGGPCATPTAERLAAGGLTYSRFHVTAMCAPTRQALLTGRNHHAVGMGAITEVATSAPGYSSLRPDTAAPLAQILKLNGYATAHVGKCHEVPVWQTSQMGPFDQWPTGGGGFEHFYGFLGAETDYYRPDLYQGTAPVDAPKTPEELKPVLARQMEVYAGYMEHTDFQVGRVVDAIGDLGILDDTLVIYITGDNGGSGEGGPNGTFNWMIPLNGAADIETPEFMAARIELFGTPEALNHYAVGWAHATNTPYQWTKQIASHWGGTRNGTIVHWPNGFTGRGQIRTQFSHVIDVAATVLDAAGIPEPAFVNGIQQMPLHGHSLVPSFGDAGVPEFRQTQYFEMAGNRGIYHQGWMACTRHSVPWILTGTFPEFDDDVWELYGPDDWSQARDLAKEMPGKLHQLQRLFLIEAVRYNVLPLDDRKAERFNPEIAGRPQLISGNTQMLYSGMRGLGENIVVTDRRKIPARRLPMLPRRTCPPLPSR